MATLTLLVALAVITVLLAPAAQRISLPYPPVLLMVGLALAQIPGLPTLTIDPDLILPLILPPLLFAAARRTSWRQFLDNWRTVGLLAVALVVVTALFVGATLHALLPGVPWAAGIALGAAVAPPDPIVATAVAQRMRLPHRLRTVLEGEGLFNDATALVFYGVAVGATMTGAFSPWKAGVTLGVSVVVGVAVGLAIAFATRWLLGHLPAHPAGSALVLVMPSAAYAAAEAAHGSGVLAVVTFALALSRHGDEESAQTRLVSSVTWDTVELLIIGVSFALVGLELRSVAAQVPGSMADLVRQALIVAAVVIVVRFAWIFAIATVDRRLGSQGSDDAEVSWREFTVASWAGMRGVVTLAAVLALPMGEPGFPERERLIVIAFVVIIVTLLGQGLTLPLVVRVLGVTASDGARGDAEQDLLRRARKASFARLEQIRERGDIDHDVLERAAEDTVRMFHSLGYDPDDEDGPGGIDRTEQAAAVDELRNEQLAAARDAVVEARDESGADPTIVDVILRRLDARGAHPE